MKFPDLNAKLPSRFNTLLTVFSAILLVFAFPNFEFWFLAYIGLVPFFVAVNQEKDSLFVSTLIGWIFGVTFFTGTCWWLTFAPITYGGVPAPLAYLLLLAVTSIVGLFPALFGGLLSVVLKRFGGGGIIAAPFLWISIEFLRFWTTGNNWNAIAYSQAFAPGEFKKEILFAGVGGIYLTAFPILIVNAVLAFVLIRWKIREAAAAALAIVILVGFVFVIQIPKTENVSIESGNLITTNVIAIQPNVPMSGLKYQEWIELRSRHVRLAELELKKIHQNPQLKDRRTVVIFPESPMNFGYTEDREFQEFIADFAGRNNVEILFNSAEPSENRTYYNSAVLVNEKGSKIAQYDKIHLVPFGEYVPFPEPVASLVPAMVGNFEIGKEYDIMPVREAKAGIMICFESHFPTLSRQFVLNGADILIEMTNDGYLGPTPILRQHLANAIFRAVETNRPILRVTNVGITGYINELGQILDATEPYTEDTRVWEVSKSDAGRTFYVRYGDWFAWFCSMAALGILLVGLWKKKTAGLDN